MGTVFSPNIITCPKCSNTFEHNMINGMALIDAVSRIDARKRMYCRLTLDGLENLKQVKTLDIPTKKLILDNFNDLNRDVQVILGFGNDLE